MIFKNLIILTFTISFFISCTTKEADKIETTVEKKSINEIENLNRWLSFHELNLSDFDTLPWEEVNFYSSEFQPSSDQEFYKEFFIYAEDSEKYIDLDSYSMMFEKQNDQLKYLGASPDTEVAVVDLKDSTRTRVLFCGPACIPEDAFWINDHTIGVVGLSDETGSNYLPFIEIYHTNENSVTRLKSSKKGKTSSRYIEEVRMPNVDFDSE